MNINDKYLIKNNYIAVLVSDPDWTWSLLDLDLRSGSGVHKKWLDRTWSGPWTLYINPWCINDCCFIWVPVSSPCIIPCCINDHGFIWAPVLSPHIISRCINDHGFIWVPVLSAHIIPCCINDLHVSFPVVSIIPVSSPLDVSMITVSSESLFHHLISSLVVSMISMFHSLLYQ